LATSPQNLIARLLVEQARIRLEHAGRNAHARARRGVRGPIRSRRQNERPAEARRERPDAAQTDGEADVRDRAVGVPQQGRCALQPARREVLMRRLAERPAELAAEVRRREVSGASEHRHVERIAVAGVDQVLCAE
jgi:hypothetical protein